MAGYQPERGGLHLAGSSQNVSVQSQRTKGCHQKVIQCATSLATNTQDSGKKSSRTCIHCIRSAPSWSFCANAGVSLDIVAEVVGHGSPAMTRHYAHISSHAKQAIINALPTQAQGAGSINEKQDADREDDERQELLKVLDRLSPEEVKSMLELARKKRV